MSLTALAPDGKPFQIVSLVNAQGMKVQFCDWGATWLSCLIPVMGEIREVLLGCQSPSDYLRQSAYLGATVGRYANRITNATLLYQHHHYHLVANQGKHLLHGGEQGFHNKRWSISQQTNNQVTFCLFSPHGEAGFPGNLLVNINYLLSDHNELIIDFNATTDKPTPVNLTNHAYFNLDGDKQQDAREQTLCIHADRYLPVNSDGIPTGDLLCVEQDDMDLRTPRKLITGFFDSEARQFVAGYDHAYLLDKSADFAARLVSADKKVAMMVKTTKPAIQVYSGNFLNGTPNRQGGEYANYAGVALETQFLPDSPNHRYWPQPDCWLTPDNIYDHQTIYHFMVQ